MLQEEDPTKYEAHFAKYLEAGIEPDKMEETGSVMAVALGWAPVVQRKSLKGTKKQYGS